MSKAEVEALKAQVAELTAELQRVRLPPAFFAPLLLSSRDNCFGGAGRRCSALRSGGLLGAPAFPPGPRRVFFPSAHFPPAPPHKKSQPRGHFCLQVHVLSWSAHFGPHLRVPSCRAARCAPPGLRPGGPDGRGVQGRTAGRPAQVWHLRQQRQPDRRGAALLLRLRLAACRHPARPDGADHAVGHALRDRLRRRQVHGPRRGPRRPRRHPAGARPRRPRHPDPVRQHGGRRGEGRLVLPLPAALGRRVRHPLDLLPAALHQPGWPPRLRRRAQRQRHRRDPGRDQGLHRQHGGDRQGAGC